MFGNKKKKAVPVGEETITNEYYDRDGNKKTERVKATKYSDGTYEPKKGIWS